MYCDVTNNQNMIYIQFADIPPVEVRTILKKNNNRRCLFYFGINNRYD